MSQILAEIPESSGAEQEDVKCLQSPLGCFWSPLLYRSLGTEEFLVFLCSVNGIFKNYHGFLAVARGGFPNSEFLGLSPGKSVANVEISNVREVSSFVAVSHVFHLLVCGK